MVKLMLSYEQFIHELCSGNLLEIRFEVVGYAHYKNCKISKQIDTFRSGRSISLIRVDLTNDASETVSFLNTLNESYKLFRMGRKGSFTLKQIWPKIKIISIVRKDSL